MPSAYPDGMSLRQIREMEGEDPTEDPTEDRPDEVNVTQHNDGLIIWVFTEGEEHGAWIPMPDALEVAKAITRLAS